MFRALLLVCCLFSSSCALGPLISHETARTLGTGNHEFTGSLGTYGLGFRWGYGISENFDLSANVESTSFSARGKYAFLNNHQGGWSLALAGGGGYSSLFPADFFHVDLMASYLRDSFEPYLNLRVVRVHLRELEFESEDRLLDAIEYAFRRQTFTYVQPILGARYWMNPRWAWSVEASSLAAIDSTVDIQSSILFGLGLSYRF